jgi:hypothetical protein
MISNIQINNKPENSYYKLGYLFTDNVVKPLCYPDLTCATKNFSMCRFPNTKWNARLYYDSPFQNCNCKLNQCDKYLFKI